MMGVYPNSWMVFVMENPIDMDDLEVPWGTPIIGNLHVTGDKQPGEVFNIRGMGLFVIFLTIEMG